MSTLEENKELICLIEKATVSAALRILGMLQEDAQLDVKRKADFSLLTNLDLESQKVIAGVIKDALPIVSEEDPESHSLLSTEKDFILCDPLDGTTNCRRFRKFSGPGQIGFGPVLGLVQYGKLQACSYFDIPGKTLFTAIRGTGTFKCQQDLLSCEDIKPLKLRRRLLLEKAEDLTSSAVLFDGRALFSGQCAGSLKVQGIVETSYKFGGFANDCARLAQGFEQIMLNLIPKAWDFASTLLAAEAGLQVLVDPLGQAMDYQQWQIASLNPVLIAHGDVIDTLLKKIKKEAGGKARVS